MAGAPRGNPLPPTEAFHFQYLLLAGCDAVSHLPIGQLPKPIVQHLTSSPISLFFLIPEDLK